MINLDRNATAPLRREAMQAMEPWLLGTGNPASAHGLGRAARRAVEDAKERIAARLGAFPDEVVITSGATEANNLALFGLAGEPPAHLLVSPVEHPCVTEPMKHLAAHGFQVETLPVDADGVVQADALASRLTDATRLVAVMLANHETGAVQPIAELAALTHSRPSIAFHCDAAQAVGKIPVDFHQLGVSTMSVSSHKLGGPPGVGLLLVSRCLKLAPMLFGGHQQRGRRPGTESPALVVGLAVAIDHPANLTRLNQLRTLFLQTLQPAEPFLMNSPAAGLPNVVNISFSGCRADALLMALDLAGVACSTGSACSSGSLLPSPVLQAMGLTGDRLRSALRFSFGDDLSDTELSDAARRIVQVVRRLRETPDDEFGEPGA